MSKKQIAGLVAAVLTAIAGLLARCPDDSAPNRPIPVMVDAGN